MMDTIEPRVECSRCQDVLPCLANILEREHPQARLDQITDKIYRLFYWCDKCCDGQLLRIREQ